MFCHKCGNKVAEGAGFCQKCGEKIIADGNIVAVSQQIQQSQQPQNTDARFTTVSINNSVSSDSSRYTIASDFKDLRATAGLAAGGVIFLIIYSARWVSSDFIFVFGRNGLTAILWVAIIAMFLAILSYIIVLFRFQKSIITDDQIQNNSKTPQEISHLHQRKSLHVVCGIVLGILLIVFIAILSNSL